jgi:lysozyme
MKRIALIIAISLTLISDNAIAANFSKITTQGPGNRIHGMDISPWQHPYDKPIDFKKMYEAGVRFVLIKGSDTIDSSDAMARKYLPIDRAAAQAAGIYTGFYHYATLPDTSKTDVLIADAKAQAQKVVWRLASIGGYTNMDLPIALDIENNCVRGKLANCKRYTSKKFVTLWSETFLNEVAAKTVRKPFVYSYPLFLEKSMVRSTELAKFPLWIAAYGKDPAVSTNQPGLKKVGCFAHSWTKANCTANWQIWQYTSCGIGSKYGVPSSHVDLNVFGGDENQFMEFTTGSWQPTPSDMLPVNEPTTMQLLSQTISDTNGTTTFVVNVLRPDNTPVVTGTVAFKSADTTMKNGTQDAIRSSSGIYTLNITKLQAGNYVGVIEYKDDSGVHASGTIPVAFTINQGPTLTPTPTPQPKPKPVPVDTCKNQIRN